MSADSQDGVVHSTSGTAHDVVQSLGIVFGDIGTSPIYTLSAIFCALPTNINNVLGTVSLIIWTLITVVSIQYTWLAMNLSKKGEGGTIVLREILRNFLQSKSAKLIVTLMSFVGISLFMGDGVITPAISILSAVEGLLLVPGFESLSITTIVTIAVVVAVLLFSVQRHGVEKVSRAFGPIMIAWFTVLAISGCYAIIQQPAILKAFNPYYGIRCLLDNGCWGAFILSGVILCATGGEALYADMGHTGRQPIRKAWIFVFIALILNYMGQGAFLLAQPHAELIFHGMLASQFPSLYIPLLILCLLATVIASQAMISGVFAVVYQGMTTGIMPRLKVDYTSSRFHAQVYIGFINWFLFATVVAIMIHFKQQTHLAAAYGLAVSGTMVITSLCITLIYWFKQDYVKTAIACLLVCLNGIFLGASLSKLEQGGYWSLIIALVPLSIILIYYFGQRKLHSIAKATPLPWFMDDFVAAYQKANRIHGTALFFVRDIHKVPSYMVQTIVDNGIVYDDNIVISIIQRETPYGIIGFFKEQLTEGLRVFEIHCGYMEVPNIQRILDDAHIQAKTIFFGLDEIVTKKPLWKIYSIIKSLSPTFVRFHKLRSDRLHGVVTLVTI